MEIEKAPVLKALKKNVLFSNNSEAFLIKMLYCGEIIDCSANEMIVEEGSEGDIIFFILNGTCAVSKRGESGQDIYITTLDEGKHFGEAGVFVDGPRTANVKSLQDVQLLSLNKNQMNQIIDTNPSEGIIFLKKIIQENFIRLRDTTRELRLDRRPTIDNILAQI